jgi:MiaB-like tRNA modifying enzyme
VAKLAAEGHEVSEELGFADYYIINTCAVTQEAEKKSRQCIARARKQNPAAKILICGCASEHNAKQFERDGVIYIGGTAKKDVLAELKDKPFEKTEIPLKYEEIGQAKSLRTRAYVKVQDGCNNFCSYCLIPYVRGRSRSRKIADVLAEVESVARTAKEIVLTGINLSAYGADIGLTLPDLIDALKGIDVRVRLGSFEMNVVDDRLLGSLKNLKAFCPHFHLSLQSGSDEVLRKMNRHYTVAEFYETVKRIRAAFPQAALTTDVIVGFPTETEENFQETYMFIEKIGFSDIHVFRYSKRSGTVAAKFKQLPPEVSEVRAETLQKLKVKLRAAYQSKFINTPLEVLFEDEEGNYRTGYSRNYIKVYAKNVERNELKTVVPTEEYGDGLK